MTQGFTHLFWGATNQLVSLSVQSPNGKLVASGAIDGIINLFDLQTGRLLHTLEGTVVRPSY